MLNDRPLSVADELPPYRTHRLPASYQEQVLTTLEEEIIDGRLEPGSRLREDELAQRLGVSRTPIREALHSLERQGLVVRIRGRGIFVTSFLSGEDLLALYRVRITLESHLAAQAAERITEREIMELDHLTESFTAIANRGELDYPHKRRLMVLDSTFHFSIYHAARTELILVVETYWGRVVREGYPLIYNELTAISRYSREHSDIIDALRNRDSDRASSAMTEHLTEGLAPIQQRIKAEATLP